MWSSSHAARALFLLLPTLPSVAGVPAAWIGGHYCTVYNANAPYVVVLYHGYLNSVSDYYPLAERFSDVGYAAIVPRDLQGADALARAASWGREVAASVRDWAGDRPVAIVGHSMGGGAAMAAAKYTPGISAYVAMHPAPIVSGIGWAKVRGPILFTTGTYDDGTFGGNRIGATAPLQALNAYNSADYPKALVNVKGNVHASSVNANGDEWLAVTHWLGCFLKHITESCEWVRTTMCTSSMLEWCYHFGVQTAPTTPMRIEASDFVILEAEGATCPQGAGLSESSCRDAARALNHEYGGSGSWSSSLGGCHLGGKFFYNNDAGSSQSSPGKNQLAVCSQAMFNQNALHVTHV